MTLSHATPGILLGLSLISGCQSPREASRPSSRPTAVDSLFYEPHGEFDDPGSLRIGDRGSRRGGGYSVSVGAGFGKPQAAEVYQRLIALEANGEFKRFSCGDSVPHIAFELTLHEEGELQERLVNFAYTPDIGYWGADQCLDRGFRYIVARTFAQVDSGPGVDYGYKNPSTGERYPPKDPGERHYRRWPTCHCEMSRDNQEWVTDGPEEKSVGATAH